MFNDKEDKDTLNQALFEDSIELDGLYPGQSLEQEECPRCRAKLREDGTVKYCAYEDCPNLSDEISRFDNWEPLRFEE